MNGKLYTKDEIVEKLINEYEEENVCLVSTKGYDLTTNPGGRNKNESRCEWINIEVADKLYGIKDRSQIIKKVPRRLSTGEYNFAYVKFASDKDGNIYGIVSGKTSFHALNPSDVWFYDINMEEKKTKEASIRMQEKNLRWYEDEILIVKNEDVLSSDEALDHEREIQEMFNLSD